MYFISQEENDMELYPLDQKHIMKTYKSGKMSSKNKDMSYLLYQNEDLTGADFSNRNISHTMFRNCIMTNANFENAKFEDVSFRDCMFSTRGEWFVREKLVYRFSIAEFNRFEIRYNVVKHEKPFCTSGKCHIVADVKDVKAREYPQSDFIGYKKVMTNDHCVALATLLIRPRNGAIVYKNDICRCAQAVVLKIEDTEGNRYESGSSYMCPSGSSLIYTVGETVFPDCFDENWNMVGSHGIHFCLTKEEAWNA